MAARKTAHVTEVPAPRSTRIITCANHKGGTGKTTTAVNVSAGLALLTKQRVLLVDCDPRGHASIALGVDIEHVRYSVTDLLTGAMTDVQALCWETGDNLKLLPANATLQDVKPELWRSAEGRLRLKQALHPLRDAFDFILIDTPPTLGLWTQAPLVASTELLIPVDVGYFALEGLRQLLDAIARLQQEVPLTLESTHILLTKFDARTTFSAHVRALLRERCGAAALHTVIHGNVALVRAQMARQSIFAYDRTSRGAQDYQHVVEELLGTPAPWRPAAPSSRSGARGLTRWWCTSGWSDERRVGLHTQAGGWLRRARRAMTGQRGVQSTLPPVQKRVVRRVPDARHDCPSDPPCNCQDADRHARAVCETVERTLRGLPFTAPRWNGVGPGPRAPRQTGSPASAVRATY